MILHLSRLRGSIVAGSYVCQSAILFKPASTRILLGLTLEEKEVGWNEDKEGRLIGRKFRNVSASQDVTCKIALTISDMKRRVGHLYRGLPFNLANRMAGPRSGSYCD